MASSPSTFSWLDVDAAIARGDASAAAALALEGLRAAPFDGRKSFFSQLASVLQRRARAPATAQCAAETGEALWAMSEFRSTHASTSAVTGDALLLAVSLAAAYATVGQQDKALAHDAEVLQSPAFFTYDGLAPLDRLACVARVLHAARVTGTTRCADSAVQKGMSLYHVLANRTPRSEDAAHQQGVLRVYLAELGAYRQERGDFLRAFQSFSALHECSGDAEALERAALCAVCIRTGESSRQAALHSALQPSRVPPLPRDMQRYVQIAYKGQVFGAADVEGMLAAAAPHMPEPVLRTALREHNIVVLARTFECVHWRSLCAHMEEAQLTEAELYDLLVSMARSHRVDAAIHQDTGFIEFSGGSGENTSAAITDTDAFNRIAAAAAAIAQARPELLLA